MGFFFQEIESYKVEAQIGAGSDRLIILKIKESIEDETDIRDAFLNFGDSFDGNAEQVGAVSETLISLFFPTAYYSDVYHILQTESPVFLDWTTNDAGKIDFAAVTSNEEPLGEGMRDQVSTV